jgi:hypothetical protein
VTTLVDFDGGPLPRPPAIALEPRKNIAFLCLIVPAFLGPVINLLPARWFVSIGGMNALSTLEKKSRRSWDYFTGMPYEVRVESRVWRVVYPRVPVALFRFFERRLP